VKSFRAATFAHEIQTFEIHAMIPFSACIGLPFLKDRILKLWPDRAAQAPPFRRVKGHNINEVSFPGSSACGREASNLTFSSANATISTQSQRGEEQLVPAYGFLIKM